AVFDYPNGIKVSFTSQTANAYNGLQILIFGDRATIVMNQNSAYINPEAQFKDYGIIDGVTNATVSSGIAEIPVNISSREPSLAALINFTNSILNGDNSICTPDD